MCGFLVKISESKFDYDNLEKSNNRIICRGPDELKVLNSNNSNFSNKLNYSLFFNRLSIIDLETGSQPIYKKESNTLLMFNGEIFNHRNLRSRLENEGVQFSTSHSDSEVILNGITRHGKNFLNELNGQFAISFIDFNQNKLILARDRLGQKPLFYSIKKDIIFGSNLKSVSEVSKQQNIKKNSLYEYLKLGVITSPNTIFENVYKLQPGEIVEVDLLTKNKTQFIYWNINEKLNDLKFEKEEFFEIFKRSVNLRLESDVPIANFLSGGVDSTSIIKAIYDSGKNINSFSAIFENKDFDESKWSRLVSEKYSTNHFEEKLDLNLSIDSVLESIDIFDEPYCDPSTVPSYYLSKLISKNYKVAISGDGGDELLGGYPRVAQALKNKNIFQNTFSKISKLYPAYLGSGYGFTKYSNNIYEHYSKHYEDYKLIQFLKIDYDHSFYKDLNKDYKNLLFKDYSVYLSEMMLLKIDRTSMANSLEVRSPFVDHELVEYIFSHSTPYFDGSNQKVLLKNYLLEDFDQKFIDRKKMGFVFDIEYFIYSNFNEIREIVMGANLEIAELGKTLNKLRSFKSRINAIRIWKIFFISRYFKNLQL